MGDAARTTAVPQARPRASAAGSQARAALIGAAVATVLADSSVVTLALPAILRSFDETIQRVSWVIVSFNLALAVAAVPAAYLARRGGAGRVCAAGLVVFALASLACALASDLEALIAARSAQAVGGAAVVCAALELLPGEVGSERAAAVVWASAAAAGAALGPAAGGALTQTFSWQAIFVVQVPLALVPLLAVRARLGAARPARVPAGRPKLAANLALGLVAAALTAALFLLVIMLIEGWRMSPLAAAATVSVMPLAAAAALPLAGARAPAAVRASAGVVLVSGGLAALGLLPHGTVAWTLAPQALVGVGLALTLSALTQRALAGRAPAAIHGGWTIASRHAGVVLGLLLLTPLFVADLQSGEAAAKRAGTGVVLDSRLSIDAKVQLGEAIRRQVSPRAAQVPDLGPIFRAQARRFGNEGEYARVESALEDQIRRAVTQAFSRSFLVAACLCALALVPLLVSQERRL